MKIQSLSIKDGIFEDKYDFKENINLIYSEINSVGKSTLLRFLLFTLGYPIPSMRGLNFNKYDLELKLSNEENKLYTVQRRRDFITLSFDNTTNNYSLPNDLYSFHAIIFNNNNKEILDNLLGAFYMDQERGWTLLNRGKAIGQIRFNIESLIRGLSNRTDSKLKDELELKKREAKKYKIMFEMSEYKQEIKKLGENIAFDTLDEEIDIQIKILLNEKIPVQDELDRIKAVIKDNKIFVDYISSYKIIVCNENGIEIPVNESTIKDYKEDKNYLIAKRKIYEQKITDIDKKISNLQKQRKEEILIPVQTNVQAFDATILRFPFEQIPLERAIARIDNEVKGLKVSLTNKVKINNEIVSDLYNLIKKYATRLHIDDKYIHPYQDYVFTDDLKSLSGAIFHKIVFCFKMAYVKIIEKNAGINLPIILDSPSGREIDEINIKEMMDILKSEFFTHQIIIASIHTYDFQDIHTIKLTDTLLHYNQVVKE